MAGQSLLLLSLLPLLALVRPPQDAADLRARETCEAIPPGKYDTGLIFNPSDLQTMYLRSQCFQELAVALRDETLCLEARERKSLFFDGSGISPKRCRALVADRIEKDHSLSETVRDVCRLAKVQFALNGNGKDFDVEILNSGAYGHDYELTIAIFPDRDEPSRELYRNHHFVGQGSKLLLLVRRETVLHALAGKPLDAPYQVEARLTLAPSSKEEAYALAYLSETTRNSAFATTVNFSTLKREFSRLTDRLPPTRGPAAISISSSRLPKPVRRNLLSR